MGRPAPHKILGVDPTATAEEIKLAYRSLCLKYHPDVAAGANKEKFIQATTAYEQLLAARSWESHYEAGGRGYRGFGSHRRGFGKGFVAFIIAVPMVLGGVRAGMIYRRMTEESFRTNGLMEPPQNPFLSAEEARRLPVRKKASAGKSK